MLKNHYYDTTLQNQTLYQHGLSGFPLAVTEKNNAGSVTAEQMFIYGPTGLFAIKSGAELTYVLKDHRGGSKILVDASGTIKASYDYTPFGEHMRETGSWDTRYQFTGQEKDEETGLYNYRARLYDPYLKRFLHTDPAGQGFHFIVYATND